MIFNSWINKIKDIKEIKKSKDLEKKNLEQNYY